MGMVKAQFEAVIDRITLAAERELSACELIPRADLADILESLNDCLWSAVLNAGDTVPVEPASAVCPECGAAWSPTAGERLHGCDICGSCWLDADGPACHSVASR